MFFTRPFLFVSVVFVCWRYNPVYGQFLPGQPILPLCDDTSRRGIAQCATELNQFGLFTVNGAGANALAFDQLRRQSKDYFLQICNAYSRFNQCMGPRNLKVACWEQEPVKGQYAVTDAALEYVCGEGYYGMLNFWDCFLNAASRQDVQQCEARIAADAAGATSFSNLRTGDQACRVLQNYMQCIKPSINGQCGEQAWDLVREAVQRPTRVYQPFCVLAGSTALPSLFLTLLAIAVATLFWKN